MSTGHPKYLTATYMVRVTARMTQCPDAALLRARRHRRNAINSAGWISKPELSSVSQVVILPEDEIHALAQMHTPFPPMLNSLLPYMLIAAACSDVRTADSLPPSTL
jgi:hypothetical protein